MTHQLLAVWPLLTSSDCGVNLRTDGERSVAASCLVEPSTLSGKTLLCTELRSSGYAKYSLPLSEVLPDPWAVLTRKTDIICLSGPWHSTQPGQSPRTEGEEIEEKCFVAPCCWSAGASPPLWGEENGTSASQALAGGLEGPLGEFDRCHPKFVRHNRLPGSGLRIIEDREGRRLWLLTSIKHTHIRRLHGG